MKLHLMTQPGLRHPRLAISVLSVGFSPRLDPLLMSQLSNTAQNHERWAKLSILSLSLLEMGCHEVMSQIQT